MSEEKQEEYEEHDASLLVLAGMAILVGCAAGVGSIFFRDLIAFIHNIFFNATFSLDYNANILEPVGPWGPFIILAPVIGGLVVVWLVNTFAPEARGHGVPEVMYAVFYKRGRIRPIVALVKSLASALSIGSGASVGREGPIIQIGATFGSTLGRIMRMSVWQTNTLVAAGAGAGIAATFNTPLGGVMFAVEVMLPEVSARTFLPVVMATGTAAYIGNLAFGLEPAFLLAPILTTTRMEPIEGQLLVCAALLGVLCGVASWAFVRLLVAFETLFPKIPGNDYSRNAIGMGIVGVMMYLLAVTYGHYFVGGVGYGTIQAVLLGQMSSIFILSLLCVLKLLATTISLGSGASGGIFSPSLFIGATLGGAFGAVVNNVWRMPEFGVPAFAIIGMAAVVGGSTGAAMTAVMMIFEMTGDYVLIVPLIVAVGCSVGVRRSLISENIYTMKLARRGVRIPKERHMNMYLVRQAVEVMNKNILVLPDDTSYERLRDVLNGKPEGTQVIVSRDGRIRGVVSLRELLQISADIPPTIDALTNRNFLLAREHDILSDILRRLAQHQRAVVLVARGDQRITRADDVVGVIDNEQVGDCIVEHYRY
jgi:CIC family chloride channel protein